MSIPDLPPYWSLRQEEISSGVYRVTARADDGRKIEQVTNTRALDDTLFEIFAAAMASDREIANRIEGKQ